MRGRHPIELFFLSHYPDLQTAAEDLGVTYQTLLKWREKPENLLKYLLTICERTDAEEMDVIKVARQSITYNDKEPC